jgi:hypothetical protein
VVYWLAGIAGGYISGYPLDISRFKRAMTARLALFGMLLTRAVLGEGEEEDMWELRVSRQEMSWGVGSG